MNEDDDHLYTVEPLPPCVPAGVYDAIVNAVTRVSCFNKLKVTFRLVTLGPFFGMSIPGYFVVPPPRLPHTAKRTTRKARAPQIPSGSKLASWIRLIAAFDGGSPHRLTARRLKGYWYQVEVGIVTANHRQEPHLPTDRYSRVQKVIGVIGKLSELPSERNPPPLAQNNET